ncbi:MAG TPA: AAA family ATPase [Bacillota bacterium]|nr:AAA family ATPase [Bacillota bacterium]
MGKTTVALNLAIAIRQLTKKRVVLMDLDLMSGNVAMMAGLSFKRSIKDLVDEINNLDEEIMDRCCIQHSSGIKILPAPVQPEYSGFIESEHVEKVLSQLTQVFNYVIVDAPTYLHDTVMPALELSQEIVMVTTLDLASIQNLKQCLDLLNGLSMRTKVKVLVNRMGSSRNLKLKDLEEALGMEIQGVVPACEDLAVEAVNMGNPLIMAAKHSPAARQLTEFAKKLMVKGDRPVEGSVFGKLARR